MTRWADMCVRLTRVIEIEFDNFNTVGRRFGRIVSLASETLHQRCFADAPFAYDKQLRLPQTLCSRWVGKGTSPWSIASPSASSAPELSGGAASPQREVAASALAIACGCGCSLNPARTALPVSRADNMAGWHEH